MQRLWLNSIVLFLSFNASAIELDNTNQNKLIAKENEIVELAKDFEATMISKVLKSVYEGIKVDTIIGGGKSELIYRDLLLEEYAQIIASRGGIGLQNSIIKDIQKSDSNYKKLIDVVANESKQ